MSLKSGSAVIQSGSRASPRPGAGGCLAAGGSPGQCEHTRISHPFHMHAWCNGVTNRHPELGMNGGTVVAGISIIAHQSIREL